MALAPPRRTPATGSAHAAQVVHPAEDHVVGDPGQLGSREQAQLAKSVQLLDQPVERPLADIRVTSVVQCFGRSYASTRRPDPRIAAAIRSALGDARSVINIGAGAGSYEPTDIDVLAVEPSATMIAQRPPGAAPTEQGTAEHLPAADQSFDAALAVLTVHHWADRPKAFEEIRRVVRTRVVFFTGFPGAPFWLYDYFPGIPALDEGRVPRIGEYERLGRLTSTVVPIPHDCTDGFLAAYWRRPDAYLDPTVRANISPFAFLQPDEVEAGVAKLRSDLASGRWQQRHGAVMEELEIDFGYRIITAELPNAHP